MSSLTSPAPIPSYSQTLALSENSWLEQLTTDIPFISVGILALAVLTCLLVTQRLSLPGITILGSALIAFFGVIFDFAELIGRSNNQSRTGSFPLAVLREVSLSISTALGFFFFLLYLGRPPRGEVALVPLDERARARRRSPSSWGHWGLTGYAIEIFIGANIVAITVLQIIWRVTGNMRGPIYMADGVIQGVVTLSFFAKVVLNSYFSPLKPIWNTLRDYSPVIVALCLRLSVVIANEFCYAFSESPIGRLLQAIEIYILILLVLISPYYSKEGLREDRSGQKKRASSFRGLRFSAASRWSALNSAGIVGNGVADYPDDGRTATQRLSSWIASRKNVKKDPQEDRLWNKEGRDIEAYSSPEIRETMYDGESPLEAKFTIKPLTNATSSPGYLNPFNNGSPGNNSPNTTAPFVLFDQNEAASGPPAVPRVPAPVVNFTSQRNSLALSALETPRIAAFANKFEARGSYDSGGSDSPIYGINGIVQKAARKEYEERARRSAYVGESTEDALERLQREQAELEKSVASMSAFSPKKSPASVASPAEPQQKKEEEEEETNRAAALSYLSAGALSYKSDISLQDFPSPPDSPFMGTQRDTIVSTMPKPSIPGILLNKESQPAIAPGGKIGTEVVDDMQFSMVPPRMPAAYEGRRASFPSAMRESMTSSLDGMARIISAYAESEDDVGGKRVRMDSKDGSRLDVTSFIGELTTPRAERPPGQLRDYMFRGRRGSMDNRLSRLTPLPEDPYSPSNTEALSNSAKSSYIPMAISTDVNASDANAPPMVSFAPVSYVPSSRPRLMNTIPANTLPASPRPPGGSPTLNNNKPVSSSPLSLNPIVAPQRPAMPLGNTGVTVATNNLVRSPVRRPTYPIIGNRPLISGPIGQVEESNDMEYESPRPVPTIKMQRF